MISTFELYFSISDLWSQLLSYIFQYLTYDLNFWAIFFNIWLMISTFDLYVSISNLWFQFLSYIFSISDLWFKICQPFWWKVQTLGAGSGSHFGHSHANIFLWAGGSDVTLVGGVCTLYEWINNQYPGCRVFVTLDTWFTTYVCDTAPWLRLHVPTAPLFQPSGWVDPGLKSQVWCRGRSLIITRGVANK